MKKIENIKDLKTFLIEKNYQKDEIDKFVEMVNPFYEFYDYMLDVHKMDYNMVEEDLSKYSESVFTEYLEKMDGVESPMKYMIEISGDILSRYSKKYDYKKPEEAKKALTTYQEIILKIQFNK